ncbi:MAG: ATP synthase F1 subunit epsilon [Alphaproteobacteria bacterium]|nr:ATP synthase F1 subunit epsilon [Alphaproteobacteria bacterium]
MANQIQLDLASPQKLAFSKPVAMVNVPGVEGVLGVLPGHAPLEAALAAGVVEIYGSDTSAITDRFFITGGFCEVTTESCTVMADEAIAVAQLDRLAIEEEIRELSAQEQDETAAARLVVAQAKMMALA